MKKLLTLTCAFVIGFLGTVFAQDGIYGSLLIGQKFVNNMAGFNTFVKNNLPSGQTLQRDFESNFWTIGGTGYLQVFKHLMVGGKAWAFTSGEIVINNPTAPDTIRKLSISGGIGMFTLGANLLTENKFGLQLYPQVGLGIAPFAFHTKTMYVGDVNIDSTASLEYITKTGNDNQATVAKGGFVIDGCFGFNWHPFLVLFPLFPGVKIWPMLHLEIGYSFIPGNIQWTREADMLGGDDWEPDIKADGLYISGGVGLGLTK